MDINTILGLIILTAIGFTIAIGIILGYIHLKKWGNSICIESIHRSKPQKTGNPTITPPYPHKIELHFDNNIKQLIKNNNIQDTDKEYQKLRIQLKTYVNKILEAYELSKRHKNEQMVERGNKHIETNSGKRKTGKRNKQRDISVNNAKRVFTSTHRQSNIPKNESSMSETQMQKETKQNIKG